MSPESARIGIGRYAVVVIVAILLVVGAVSFLYLSQALNPKKITLVHVSVQGVSHGNVAPATYSFSPKNITVVIGVNNTVQWTNTDQSAPEGHTFTQGKPVVNSSALALYYYDYPPTTTFLFNSGVVKQGGNYTYTFTTAGVYEYYCAFHAYMIGFVIVKA